MEPLSDAITGSDVHSMHILCVAADGQDDEEKSRHGWACQLIEEKGFVSCSVELQ
jgi:hypothetical protein